MDQHVYEYYRQSSEETSQGHFHSVIELNQSSNLRWEDVRSKIPALCKGWFELSRLSVRDRLDFIKEFWLSKLPYHPRLTTFLDRFFSNLDDVGIFLVQRKFDDPYVAHMVYSLKGERGFFRGLCPITENETLKLKTDFTFAIFPADYIAFLQIHNGFTKTTDTGLIPSGGMRAAYEQFQTLVGSKSGMVTCDGKPVDPQTLIPFYDSFGMPFFQCFWSDWYPEDEMGNVYYSGVANTISTVAAKGAGAENMSFATFTEWLMFYLEMIE